MNTNSPHDQGQCSWDSLAQAANFRIGKLAGLCAVSIRTLQRHFRKHYNLTLSEWLREKRLQQARLMLVNADCIKTVAFDLGYKQPSHFTRDFKQRFGVPPTLWQIGAGVGQTFFQQVRPVVNLDPAQKSEIDLFVNC